MKYKEIVQNEHSDKVGSVDIRGIEVQLCDHIDVIDGEACVSAIFEDKNMVDPLQSLGVPTKAMHNGTLIAYLTEQALGFAVPKYDDGATDGLIRRLGYALRKERAAQEGKQVRLEKKAA